MADKRKGPIPTGWMQRGARLAGQTGKSAARFVGTRARAFAAPDRAQEFLDGFHQKTAKQLVDMLGEMKGPASTYRPIETRSRCCRTRLPRWIPRRLGA
jgi:hypothetical protein